MKELIIVNGVPCSGKTHYIQKNYKEYKYIDVKVIQKGLRNFYSFLSYFTYFKNKISKDSYKFSIKKTIEYFKENDKIVLEVFMISERTQKRFVKRIKASLEDVNIKYIFIDITDEKLKKNIIKRNNKKNIKKHTKKILNMKKEIVNISEFKEFSENITVKHK